MSFLKEKNLLPVGANSFLLEKTSLQKGFDVQKLSPFHKMAVLISDVSSTFNTGLGKTGKIAGPDRY